MHNLSTKINGIQAKIQKLLSLHQQLKSQNAELLAVNKAMNQLVEEKKKLLEALEEKNKIVRLAKSIEKTPTETTELKSKINELIREVDKCIAFLNN